MLPAAYTPFFTAAVGSAGALIGLLFIAISIAPESTVGKTATPEREAVAANAFAALTNVFFLSLVALIPVTAIGDALLLLGSLSCVATIRLVMNFTVGRWRPKGRLDPQRMIRRLAMAAASLTIYGCEVWLGVEGVTGAVRGDTLFSATAILIVGGYALALARMWSLLGARKDSIFAWFSVLNDAED